MRRILALTVGIAVSVASSAAAAPTLIAPLHGGTAIESFGDLQVWSDYNATDQSWHLVVDSGGLISTPPIPAATDTIEADVGPGPSGSPLLVYKVCPAAAILSFQEWMEAILARCPTATMLGIRLFGAIVSLG